MEKTITSLEIKKGAKVRLTNGWKAEILDNQRGNIRMANVHGLFTEMGSIYIWDIDVVENLDGTESKLILTDKQQASKKMSQSAIF